MHETGEIDAVGALLDPAVNWDWTPEWLARQRIVAALLPRLVASVERMTAAIGAVQERLVQHVLDEAFLSWCEADLGRADEVIALVEGQRHIDSRFVLAALIAGLRGSPERYLDISVSMAIAARPGGRHLGVRALATMPAIDDASVARAVEALGSVIKDRDLDGSLRAEAVYAAMEIAVRAPSAPPAQFLELVHLAAEDMDPALLDACAGTFGRHACRFSAPLLGGLREVLPKLGADRTQAINEVDMGLYQLLSTPDGNDRALGIIEALIRREEGASILERLNSTGHEISNGNGARLDGVVVRWLLSAEPALCNAAATLIGRVHGQDPSLAVAPNDFRLTDAQASFLVRKAIGWFLIKPAAVTSLAVSVLRQVTDEGTATIADLLYDPLLMNYPGSVRRRLEAAASDLSGAAREAVDRTLARHDAYLRAIEAVGTVPELHQSERNRRIEATREDDEFRAARRVAEGKSVLRLIGRTSLLLHGTRSISYVEDFGGGDARRLDSKLGRMSVEMERPMQWTFDPVGLEHTLLAFRLERPPE